MKKIIPILLVLSIFTGCSFTSELSSKGDAVVDQKFYDQATQSSDLSLCNQILNKELKTECVTIVDAGNITRKAVSELNLSLCQRINIGRYRVACTTQVQPLIDAKKLDEERLTIEQKAYDQQNAKLCDQVKDENQRATCKYNILANQAVSKKDPSLCNGIGQQDMVDRCKSIAK